MKNSLIALLDRYNVPGGRYTYYPFHAKWNNEISKKDWINLIRRESPNKIDLYIHIPFCHSLCTFCGCNIKVMKSTCDNQVYIKSLKREWEQYGISSKVDSIYIGGGTPNFLSPAELSELISTFNLTDNALISIELDPRYLTKDDLTQYKKIGINRLSIGIQDFEENVLENVNRSQNNQQVIELINFASTLDFEAINLDFIYGLNYQTRESFKNTLNKLQDLKITSVSLYPFAKVPWQNNSQKAFGEIPDFTLHDLNQFQADAKEILINLDFEYIGMGFYSREKIKLKRNIMGFSPRTNDFLIGLGVSAISSAPFGHLQNEKIYNKYLQTTKEEAPAIFKSHRKSEMENERQIFFREVICTNFISKNNLDKFKLEHTEIKMQELIQDELLSECENGLEINRNGRFFHKTILQYFDPNFIL